MPDEHKKVFGNYEEEAIISLILDCPEFFTGLFQYIEPDFFQIPAANIIYKYIYEIYTKHKTIPSRNLIKDIIYKKLTVDDDYDDIVELLNRKSDAREVPILKENLIEWARHRALGMLYTEDAYMAWEQKDYNKLNKIFEDAQRIADVTNRGSWFFDTIPTLFQEDVEEKLTCGFKPLDELLNDGGPTRGEVVCYMAPTGVGKSIALINAGVANYRAGYKIAHFTFELSDKKTRLRYMGVLTGEKIRTRENKQSEIERKLRAQQASYGDNIIVYEFPPDEHSVDTIYHILEMLRRTEGWKADVIILDYLEQMVSRNKYYNREEYARQKKITTEVRGLAINENALVITATQTNRPLSRVGKEDVGLSTIGLDRIAESFGKAFPLDYIISINQTPEEYTEGRVRLYIAKNRNGRTQQTVRSRIDYNSMIMKPEL